MTHRAEEGLETATVTASSGAAPVPQAGNQEAVSYTHLTLPTIYSV